MHFEIYRADDGFRWRLRAINGAIIADSGESYDQIADCRHGIALIQEFASGAEVQDLTGIPR